MIQRKLHARIEEKRSDGKAIILLGPRQVGKTTLIRALIGDCDHLFLDGDDALVRSELESASFAQLQRLIGDQTIVFLDEAQRISNVDLSLKMIVDRFKDVQLLVSGSSALELNQEIQEPLTGRKWEYLLLPISWEEFVKHEGLIHAESQLERRLIFGMYPEVVTSVRDEREILEVLSESLAYKDLAALGSFRKPQALTKLLKALALQLGSEVSYSEISRLIGIDKNTVSDYIDFLEKSFLVFSLPSFSRNHRSEIKKGKKVYFYDNGFRNALLNNFAAIDARTDKGALWENFLIAERIKLDLYSGRKKNYYFWRTVRQNEIDLIEEYDGELSAFEFKWRNKPGKFPKAFTEAYPEAKLLSVDRSNYRDFILD